MRIRPFWPLLGVPAVLLLVPMLLPLTHSFAFERGFPVVLKRLDFRQFYVAGLMVRGECDRLYDIDRADEVQARLLGSIKEDGVMPFAYPAFVALLFVPFSVLPYPAAYLLMLGCNLFLLGLLMWIMAKGLSLQEHQIALLSSTILTAFPVYANLVVGQVAFVGALLFGLFVIDLICQRDVRAGIWVGLLLFKPPMMLVPLLVLLWRRSWKAMAVACSVAGALAALSVELVGWRGIQAELALWRVLGAKDALPPNLAKMQNLRALAHVVGLGDAAWVVASCAVVAVLWLAHRRSADPIWFLGAATIVPMLVLPHYHYYDLSLAIITLALIISRYKGKVGGTARRALTYAVFSPAVSLAASRVTGKNFPIAILILLATFAYCARRCLQPAGGLAMVRADAD
jgi:hypothetical protein